jgi:protein-tyrosine phosphatase
VALTSVRTVPPSLRRERLRWAELVLVMEKHHRDAVLAMDPTARGKTFLLGHWTNTEIPDPYRRG